MKTLYVEDSHGNVFWNLYERSDFYPYIDSSRLYDAELHGFETTEAAQTYSMIVNQMFRRIYNELPTNPQLLIIK